MVTFLRLPSFTVELEVDGRVRRRRTPLVFVGVGERALGGTGLGARREGGRRGLHVLVVKHTGRFGLLRGAVRVPERA